MAVQTGKSYELRTQQLFQDRFDAARVPVVVQHNVRLRGLRSVHQIDVYWELELAGVTYRTVVSCKDWSYPVEQEHLFAFKTILDDLPGQPRGIFVARSGFQRGARRFAEVEGIALVELRAGSPSEHPDGSSAATPVVTTCDAAAPSSARVA